MPADPLKPPPSYGTLATALSVRGMFIAQVSGIILGRGASTQKDHEEIRRWLAEIEAALQAHERAVGEELQPSASEPCPICGAIGTFLPPEQPPRPPLHVVKP